LQLTSMRIVVIGNGMVGYKFCEKLIAKSRPQEFSITVFGEAVRPSYERAHLSEFFSDKSAEDLTLASENWYCDNNITLHLGDPIQHIDRINKVVKSFHGIEISYDVLILATGSSAFVPSIP